MRPEPTLGGAVPSEAQPPPLGRHDQVVDPDVDLHDPAQLAEIRPHEWILLAAIAAGGIVGAEARYGLSQAVRSDPGQFPWATLLTNVSGCLFIGVLMVVLLDVVTPHRLLRPFLGVGVLGGYTTFSTFGIDAVRLVRQHHTATALLYVAASVVACLVAVWCATALTYRVFAGPAR